MPALRIRRRWGQGPHLTGDLVAHCRDLPPHLAAEKGEGLSITLESTTTKLLMESGVSKKNLKGNG